jgi:hypothetical protein
VDIEKSTAEDSGMLERWNNGKMGKKLFVKSLKPSQTYLKFTPGDSSLRSE